MLRRKPSPEDIVAAIYEEEGFYEVERGKDLDSDYITKLVLSNGRRELTVSILGEEAFLSKGGLQDALLKAEKLKGKFDGVIIAVPRKYQRAVDEDVMSLHGFGFVIYDKLGAEEILPPRLRETSRKTETEPSKNTSGEEIVSLRMELSKILRALEELEARLDRLEREQNKLSSRLSGIERQFYKLEKPMPPRIEEKAEKIESTGEKARGRKLPSYLLDNPWVDILSKRE